MFRTPKTARSRRSIALSDESVRVLRAHRKEQVERPLLLGEGYADDDLVFAAVDGNPLPPYRASQAFRRLVQRIKLGQFRFHDLRHRAAVSAPTLNLPRRRALGLFVANIVVVAPPVPTPAVTPVVMPVPAPVGVPPVPAPVPPGGCARDPRCHASDSGADSSRPRPHGKRRPREGAAFRSAVGVDRAALDGRGSRGRDRTQSRGLAGQSIGRSAAARIPREGSSRSCGWRWSTG
jgi:hypothetical protein